MNTFYTWHTEKVGETFEGRVIEVTSRATLNAKGLYADSLVIATYVRSSRAIAKLAAQKHCRSLRKVS